MRSEHGPLHNARSSVLTLSLKDPAALHASYMPLLEEGGLFIATTETLHLGDALNLLLKLPDDVKAHPVAGRVAWITPPRAQGGRTQGVGMQFAAHPASRQLRHRIEAMLGATPVCDRHSLTL